MNFSQSFVLAAASLALATGTSYADTRSSDQDKATMEHKASPSNPTKQDEEQAEAHGQPDTPHATGGTSSAGSSKPRAAKPAKKKEKDNSSGGSSSPSSSSTPLQGERERAFKLLDLDGDGAISKAEAAGNAALVTAFDRADRNHDGKLSPAEYAALSDRLEKAGPKTAATAR
jgi:hypothetical protein